MKRLLVVGLGSIGRRHTDNFSAYFDEIDMLNNYNINKKDLIDYLDER